MKGKYLRAEKGWGSQAVLRYSRQWRFRNCGKDVEDAERALELEWGFLWFSPSELKQLKKEIDEYLAEVEG